MGAGQMTPSSVHGRDLLRIPGLMGEAHELVTRLHMAEATLCCLCRYNNCTHINVRHYAIYVVPTYGF